MSISPGCHRLEVAGTLMLHPEPIEKSFHALQAREKLLILATPPCTRTIQAVVLSFLPSTAQLFVVELSISGAEVDRSNVPGLTAKEKDPVIVFEAVEVDEMTFAIAIRKSIKTPCPDFASEACCIPLDVA